MVAHLNSNNAQAIDEAARNGDEKASAIAKAMMYQVAKYIGSMHAALCCKTEAVLVTGGIAYNEYFMNVLKEYAGGIAPIFIYPGEDELGALAENAYNVLTGIFEAKEY